MTAHGKKGFGGGTALPLRSCLFAVTGLRNQDPFLSSRGKKRFSRLAAMPLAGLLRDGSPEARLRIRRCACICHRQRLAPDLQRKATRGSVLWTPRRSGEAKGKTRVAARAVRRGLEPRIPLTLKHTSDRDEPPPLPAARENMHNKKPRHCEPVTDVTGVVYALRVQSVSSRAVEDARPYRGSRRFSSQAALRTVPRPGMDLAPEVYNVRYPRVQSHVLHDVARVWRPFLFGVQEPFLFSRKTEKRNGS